MKFKKYQHIERLGTPAVEGILNGSCYIFPKLDGTNTSVYLNDNGEMEFASRNRALTPFKDNYGVRNALINDARFKDYLEAHPTHRLFGEWLVPHTIRGYQASAWHKLYIFDVMDGDKYIPYFDYMPELIRFDIDFIPLISRRLIMGDDKKKLVQIANQIIYGGRPGSITYIDNNTPIALVRHDATDVSEYATMIVAMIVNLARGVGMEPIEIAKTLVGAVELVDKKNALKEHV